MMDECPVLKIPCPEPNRPRRGFWGGLIRGGDGDASMAKGLAWCLFMLISVSWFYFPERAIGELLGLFVALLGYIFSGKWVWHKYHHGEEEEKR